MFILICYKIMKIIDDENAYVNSLLLIILLVPIFLIIIFSVSLSYTLANDSAGDLSSSLLTSSSLDVEDELMYLSMMNMHDLSKYSFDNRQVLSNSTKMLRNMIQEDVNKLTAGYYKRGILINCTIINVYPSDNPFCFDVYYRIESTFINDSSKHILSKNKIAASIVDSNYPVYDVYPLFMSNVDVVNDSYLYHDNDEAYSNAHSGIIIKKCPYEDYTSHAHSNTTMIDCLNNHYYHFSHDGLCVFCRLENKTTCNHNGLETFIVPSNKFNQSTSSICHVYFNRTSEGHYNGSLHEFNTSFIYLDNAHGDKYGY